MKSILNFLSEEKHSISFLLLFSEIALMIYGYIIDFHFGNMFSYLFFASIIFSFLSVPFLMARELDRNSNCIRETNGYYIFGLFFNFLFILFLIFNGAKEINSNEYEFLPRSYIQSELDDNKITYFEAFKILNRENSASIEAEKEIKKDADNKELEKRELIKERTQAGLAAARARGRNGGRPRKMDEHTIKMAVAAMSDRNSVAHEVAKRLNITTTTLYTYVNGDGSLKEAGTKLLNQSKRETT